MTTWVWLRHHPAWRSQYRLTSERILMAIRQASERKSMRASHEALLLSQEPATGPTLAKLLFASCIETLRDVNVVPECVSFSHTEKNNFKSNGQSTAGLSTDETTLACVRWRRCDLPGGRRRDLHPRIPPVRWVRRALSRHARTHSFAEAEPHRRARRPGSEPECVRF